MDADLKARAERLALTCTWDAGLVIRDLLTYAEQVTRDLAECYRESGADSDGNEDWRLAPNAVAEVARLRADYDEACEEVAALTAERDALREKVIASWDAAATLSALYGRPSSNLHADLARHAAEARREFRGSEKTP